MQLKPIILRLGFLFPSVSVFGQSLDGLAGAELTFKRNESLFTFAKGIDSHNSLEVYFANINVLWRDPYRQPKTSISVSGIYSLVALAPFIGGEMAIFSLFKPVALPILLLNSKWNMRLAESAQTFFSDRTNSRLFVRLQTDHYARPDPLIRISPGIGIELTSVVSPPFESTHKLQQYGFHIGIDATFDWRRGPGVRYMETRLFVGLRFSQHTL